ncbi:hypothetical protein [Burkholderia sp. 567]|uniref:hypothetical protein n=1 Tax=Burkholderia sp. 567 TaxID=3156413 RepID=UPI003395ABA2
MSIHRPNHDAILSTFLPGKVNEATAVAAKFKLRATQLKPTLEALVANGRLKRGVRKHGARVCPGYALPSGAETDAQTAGISIAGPKYVHDWKTTLTGYDREIRSRAALCMAARTR